MTETAASLNDVASDTPAVGIRWGLVFDHAILIAGSLFMLLPVYLAFMTSTHEAVTVHIGGVQYLPGDQLLENYSTVLFDGIGFSGAVNGTTMMMNSMILGFGFAPFTGGAISYIDGMGTAAFVDMCKKLQKKYGAQFKPNKLLLEMAKTDEKFYDRFNPESGEPQKKAA